MKRIKKYNGEENSFVDEEGRSIKSEESSEPLTPAQRIEFSESTQSFSKAAPKQRIVSKKELEESGLELRDFLNRERGLTRREDLKTKPAEKLVSGRMSPQKREEIIKSAPAAQKVSETPKTVAKTAEPVKEKYETPYDRMNRKNREAEAAKKMAEASKSEPKRSGYTMPKASEFTGMGSMKFAGGGKTRSASSRADGIAIRGKTRA